MKKEYLLLVVVIIGLGALLFYQKKGRTNYQLPVQPVLEKAVDRLVIEKSGKLVESRLVEGKWVVGPEQYRANVIRIEKMIGVVKGLKLTALISEKGNYQLYELTPEKKIKVKLYHTDQLMRELQIGKSSTSLKQTYVMLKDDPKVYQALGNLKSNFFSTVAELRDKKVFEVSEKTLAGFDEIVLQRQKDGEIRVLRMTKVKSETDAEAVKTDRPVALWRQENGAPVGADAVSELLKNLSDLRCESFIENGQLEEFEKAVYRVMLKGAGEEFSLALLAPENDKYPALSSQSPDSFWLSSGRAEQIVKDFAHYTSPRMKAVQVH